MAPDIGGGLSASNAHVRHKYTGCVWKVVARNLRSISIPLVALGELPFTGTARKSIIVLNIRSTCIQALEVRRYGYKGGGRVKATTYNRLARSVIRWLNSVITTLDVGPVKTSTSTRSQRLLRWDDIRDDDDSPPPVIVILHSLRPATVTADTVNVDFNMGGLKSTECAGAGSNDI